MNSKLILSSTIDMPRDQWLSFRKKGIGASDVGCILGFNQYKSSIELYYERLGRETEYTIENIAAFMGRELEDYVANLWQYWGGTEKSLIENYRAGKIVRKCQRVNAYVQNPEYPWLFVSLDRKINKGSRESEGALEIKTIAGHEAAKWESGIPPAHIVQVITQMLVCIFEFGEIATFRDGRFFDVWPFEFTDQNKNIAQQIIERTKDFWDRVETARKYATQKYEAVLNHNMRLANQLQAEIEALEPEPDGSEAYEKFIKDKYKKSIAQAGMIKGTAELLTVARNLKDMKEQIKELDEKARLHESILKRALADNRIIDFGKEGQVKWDGEPRRFYNQIKVA